MPKCVYCGEQYEFPRGLTLVMNDGHINHLCSSKCRKNMKMKRRKVRWISKKKEKTAKEIKEEIKQESEEAEESKIEIPVEEESSKKQEKSEEKKEEKAEDKKE